MARSQKAVSGKAQPSNSETKKAPVPKAKGERPVVENATVDNSLTEEVGSEIVTLDRRGSDRRQGEPSRVQLRAIIAEEKKKAKVQRRRQIDPTTCERDYSEDEVEFMTALEQYKRSSGRMFPTCSEILEVIRAIGYVKQEVEAKPIVVEMPMTTGAVVTTL